MDTDFSSDMLFALFYFYSYAFNDDQVEMIPAAAITTKKFILIITGYQTREDRPTIYQVVIGILHKSTIIEGIQQIRRD